MQLDVLSEGEKHHSTLKPDQCHCQGGDEQRRSEQTSDARRSRQPPQSLRRHADDESRSRAEQEHAVKVHGMAKKHRQMHSRIQQRRQRCGQNKEQERIDAALDCRGDDGSGDARGRIYGSCFGGAPSPDGGRRGRACRLGVAERRLQRPDKHQVQCRQRHHQVERDVPGFDDEREHERVRDGGRRQRPGHDEPLKVHCYGRVLHLDPLELKADPHADKPIGCGQRCRQDNHEWERGVAPDYQ